jgi:hypothetical protein
VAAAAFTHRGKSKSQVGEGELAGWAGVAGAGAPERRVDAKAAASIIDYVRVHEKTTKAEEKVQRIL